VYDRPGLILLILCAAFGPLVGFALMEYFGLDISTGLTALFIDFGTWYILYAFVDLMIADWKSLNARDGVRPSVAQSDAETRRHGLIDMNSGKMLNAFRVPAVKIDARKHFAITLWRQLEYHGHDAAKLDLTEEYWLKVKPKKWKGKNEEFRQCMHDWDGVVFQKSDPTRSNSRYVLRDESELKRKADGR